MLTVGANTEATRECNRMPHKAFPTDEKCGPLLTECSSLRTLPFKWSHPRVGGLHISPPRISLIWSLIRSMKVQKEKKGHSLTQKMLSHVSANAYPGRVTRPRDRGREPWGIKKLKYTLTKLCPTYTLISFQRCQKHQTAKVQVRWKPRE